MTIYLDYIKSHFKEDFDLVWFDDMKNPDVGSSSLCFIKNDWAQKEGLRQLLSIMTSGKNVNIVIVTSQTHTEMDANNEIDLGAIAMTFSRAYVATVALEVNKAQAKKAFEEALKYKGVSVILAYEFLTENEFDRENRVNLTQAVVNSGQWLLYRNNPELAKRGFNSFQLDSEVPSMRVEEYIRLKNPIAELLSNDFLSYKNKIKEQQTLTDQKFDKYLALSSIGYVNRSKLLQNNSIRRNMFPKK